MAKKKTSLAEALKKEEAPLAEAARPRSRDGEVNITAYFHPDVKRSLLSIRAEHPQLTQKRILAEALDMVFAKYGAPQVAVALS